VIFAVPVPAKEQNIIERQTLHGFKALLDTGAQCSCISQRVAPIVGLTPRGRGLLASASETRETNTFLFNIGFPMSMSQDPSGLVSGSMQIFGPLRGLEMNVEEEDDVDVLIGLDVLGRGVLHVAFDGRFTFSW
jgi:hypothetical protein